MTLSIFARIGDIKGESHDSRHRDEIEVLSWLWGLSQSTTAGRPGGAGGGGGRTGRPTVHGLTFTHSVDRASPLLMKACARGEHIRDATITVRKAGSGQHDYLVVTLTDALVSSVSTNVDAEAGTTIEVVVLEFGKVDIEYRPQKPDGSLDTGIHFTHDQKAQH
ncbi:type VI secretion system receptor/chaperone Hcp [Knoellia locipacati]|uniref:Protein hcp1 n=1 Tax=Knoellia locipacati TaxID=882824 RepID=A0A512T182_9MICO|nr:type VI secretion system tube protein Hcp [Knoellia locipacati]GEQ13982.1 protein hcp1 [Knoellia locipacati]